VKCNHQTLPGKPSYLSSLICQNGRGRIFVKLKKRGPHDGGEGTSRPGSYKLGKRLIERDVDAVALNILLVKIEVLCYQ
jgi:hypothetical protein